MAQSGQKLSQTGTYNLGANTRATFDPGLRDHEGNVLTPNLVKVYPEGLCGVVSRGVVAGCFDIQNFDDTAREIFWLAEFNHSVANPNFQNNQTGVDSVAPVSANGVDPSATAALPVEVFNGMKDIASIAATGAVTVAQCRNGLIEVETGGGAVVVTLPSVGVNEDGLEVIFKREGANLATIQRADADTIDGAVNTTLPLDDDSVTLVYRNSDTDWKIV